MLGEEGGEFISTSGVFSDEEDRARVTGVHEVAAAAAVGTVRCN